MILRHNHSVGDKVTNLLAGLLLAVALGGAGWGVYGQVHFDHAQATQAASAAKLATSRHNVQVKANKAAAKATSTLIQVGTYLLESNLANCANSAAAAEAAHAQVTVCPALPSFITNLPSTSSTK